MRKQKRTVRGPRTEIFKYKPNPQLSLRVTPEQMAGLAAKATEEGYLLSDWARATLLKAAGVAP